MRRKRSSESCDIDMTPMIDVVFQMIIFFIVTMKMDENVNPDIILEDARESPVYKGEDKRTLIIEVDKRGWLSINNYQLNETKLRQIVQARYDKYRGSYPIMIRADRKTRHEDVRKVMDICTGVGLWRIDFAAIQEKAN
jgi:biopolymer transport protein ExbD